MKSKIHFIRFLLTKLKNQNIGKSIVSFLFLIASVVSLTLLVDRSQLIPNNFVNVSDTTLFMLIGVVLLYVIIFIQLIELLYYFIFSKEVSLIAGMNVGDSIFNYKTIIDQHTKHIILVSQNFRGAINKDFKELSIGIIKGKNKGKVLLIGTTFSAMKEICPGGELDYLSTLKDLKEMYISLDLDEQKLLRVVFHPSASSLTVFFRDPNHKKLRRRIAIIGPKFAQDKNAPNRLFCIIESWKQKDLYDSFFQHIQYMANPNNCQFLNQFCQGIKADPTVYAKAKPDEKEAIDYFCDSSNQDLSVFDYFTWYD